MDLDRERHRRPGRERLCDGRRGVRRAIWPGRAWYGIGCGLSYLINAALARFVRAQKMFSPSDYFARRYRSRATRLIYSVTGDFSAIALLASLLLASRAIFRTLRLTPRWE